MLTKEEICERSRYIADALYSSPEMPCHRHADGKPTACLRLEEARKPTKAERKIGHTYRPFILFDAARLCRPCQAYWYAEMAAQTLHLLRTRD